MNKSQFLGELNEQLKAIPLKERQELIEDFVSHFEFGIQEGKSEEELVRELGNPKELALDAINEYKRTQSTTTASIPVSSPKTARTVFSIIGLFLLNFVCAVIPLIISIWAVWISLFIAFACGVLTPLVAVVDFSINSHFSIGKLSLSLILSGVSIFTLFGVLFLGKHLVKITASYYKWNLKIIKGAE